MADQIAPHQFLAYGGERSPNACMRCGLPPHNVIHIHPPEKAVQRLARDELFMQVAELFAQRSSCERGHVGAVLVRDGRIISCGYNGAPPGMQHCSEVGCDVPEDEELGCQRTIHAEANAIVWAARMGVPTYDSIMYSTHSPCLTCARLIIAAGIFKVVFRNDYRLARLDILDAAHISTEKL
jgi:dCMP deaminase